ncbi:hypothetical protein P152DRAFT_484111 [Eremomyces bilateralis CBS 781.70]|uniref:DNA endonuclease activator Ctp1 C-terminal domain-containing protein n=1 Tax=Eremomyces bilateralis CBS 781.70 TaxID=1392243 RepID=A0A6G1FWL2_9PEZI|nr:uncharacterized protein P152DRAFT_484111 [Eremomyces bilateralis CBS 781.70]KAF1810019.1 hypothetical protein P152DRAFT_484111 [Eremomyces bilateralis CBS 781.70]
MASEEWLQHQNNAITIALKNVSGVFEDSLSQLKEHVKLCEGRIKDKDDTIDVLRHSNESLEEENRRLREQLLSRSATKGRTNDPDSTVNYEELQRNINALTETNANLQTSTDLAVKRLKEAKTLVVSWQKYFEKKHGVCCGPGVVSQMKGFRDCTSSAGRATTPPRNIMSLASNPLPDPLVIPESPSVARHYDIEERQRLSSSIDHPPADNIHRTTMELSKQSTLPNGQNMPMERIIGYSTNDVVKSSQATEGEPLSLGAQEESLNQRDEDEPVVVSERLLPRRRPARTSSTADPSRGSPEDPIVVKEETMSSQATEGMKRTLGRVETLDDETQFSKFSPRKRMKMAPPLSAQLSSSSVGIPDRACSLPAEESQRMTGDDRRRVSGSHLQTPAALPRPQSDPEWNEAEDDMVFDQHQATLNASKRIPQERFLHPIDANFLPRATISESRRGSRRKMGSSEHKIGYLAEDATLTDQTNTPHQEKNVRSEDRLFTLLAAAEPSPRQTITPRRSPSADRRLRKSLPSHAPEPRTARKTRSKQVANVPTPQSAPPRTRVASTEVGGPSKQFPTKRLRDLPVRELNLEDFRVNPNLNEGIMHAFSEVVRGHARKCLPGCTDPSCCGQNFLAMAENAGPEMFDVPKGFASSQESISAEEHERDDQGNFIVTARVGGTKTALHPNDIRVLKNYLGQAFSFDLLSSMNAKGLKDTVSEARADWLSEKYGRHRQAFTRRPTPPLYWRTDMPSTQELEKQRKEAKEANAKEVQERARIALRGGGRWVFRDEV